MFEDMREASVIDWICLEIDSKYIVLIFSCNMQILCTGFGMLQLQCRQMELGKVLYFVESEAVDNVTRLWVLVEVRDCGIISKASQPRRSARVRGDMAKHISARTQSDVVMPFRNTYADGALKQVSESLLGRVMPGR